jgi:tripartite-type tricarboxylate transporter receptor subunit TctC
MKNSIKSNAYIFLVVVACLCAATLLHAQEFPVKPIRVIIPYAAGGGSDISTRIVQAKAIELLGQSLIVDNRAGGSTLIGTRMVQTAPADGYTVGVMDPAFVINPTLTRDAGYTVQKDFTAVTLISTTPLILVINPNVAAKSVKELVDLARASPGKLNFGSPGDGSAGHLAMEQFRAFFKLNMVHVAYKGAGPAVTALVAGEVPMLLAGSGAVPFVQDGRLRGLAATSGKRLASIPNVPTFSELGFPQVNVQTFAGVVAPAGIPRAALRKLNAAFAGAALAPEVKTRLDNVNQIAVGNTPEEFATFLRENSERLNQVVREARIKPS